MSPLVKTPVNSQMKSQKQTYPSSYITLIAMWYERAPCIGQESCFPVQCGNHTLIPRLAATCAERKAAEK